MPEAVEADIDTKVAAGLLAALACDLFHLDTITLTRLYERDRVRATFDRVFTGAGTQVTEKDAPAISRTGTRALEEGGDVLDGYSAPAAAPRKPTTRPSCSPRP